MTGQGQPDDAAQVQDEDSQRVEHEQHWQYRHRKRCEDGDGELLINCIPARTTIDICKDNKIYKEIIKQGTGDEYPHKGVDVTVHYSGYLADDTYFGTSTSPYTFKLGKPTADIVPGWHIAIPTMKKGEIATIIVHPALGFGTTGYIQRKKKIVPGNATLYFQVELIDWEPEDISSNYKAKEIFRKRIKPGPNEHFVPNAGATIKVGLKGTYDGKVFDEREVEFDLGEGENHNICTGLEHALTKFVGHEISRITISPSQAFGTSGSDKFGIPPNATVEYVVELKSIQRAKEAFEIDGQEKLRLSRILKQKGIDHVKTGQFRLAAMFFKRVTDYLVAAADLEGDDEEERRTLTKDSFLNGSHCNLKLGKNVTARNCAIEGLKFDPTNEKGLYRLGAANIADHKPGDAKADFEKLLNLYPRNRDAQKQLQIAVSNIARDRKDSNPMYTRMSGALGIKSTKKKLRKRRTAF